MKHIAAAITLFTITAAQAQDFASTVKASLEKAATSQTFAVPGADANWRFLVNELKHLQHGDIAAADLAKINAEGTDPLPAIVKYNDELKALGVELLVVPVPPKAAIYPEKLAAGATMDGAPSLAGFQKKITDAGVAVLDLEAAFKKAKAEKPDMQLYCATDSHWSPHGAALAASLVAEKYKSRPELVEHQLRDLVKLKESTLEFHGDLLTGAEKAAMPMEKLPVIKAGVASDPDGTEAASVESAEHSPVMVIGDSHCQVFRRGGNMHTIGAGFIDHLIFGLGAPVHEISTQASGGEGPRIEIARITVKNPDFWAKKKIVIWLFTAREFTQGRWKILPAKVQKK
jgi:alginate O-acetyltransferase complex protein AlgJ